MEMSAGFDAAALLAVPATSLGLVGDSLSRGVKSVRGKVVAVDFESFYDSKSKYSLRNLDNYSYIYHPRFDAYLVSIVSDAGEVFVGRPADFDWGSLEGAVVAMHNAGFDGLVLRRLQELGIAAGFNCEIVDTADMVSFYQRPRSLKDAVKSFYGVELSKAVRSNMDGKTFAEAIAAGGLGDLLDYAASDAVWTLKLWLDQGPGWPRIERMISRCNREAGWKGIAIHRGRVEAGLATLKRVRDTAASKLPWTNTEDPRDARAAGSLPAMAAYARSVGIEPPPSFKKDDPAMMAWVEKHGPEHEFIGARLEHAAAVPHIARLESMLVSADSEDIVRFGLKYFGAHTGRASGASDSDAKVNMLNIPKDPKKTFGVDLRGMFVPRRGHVFGIADFAQIEARIVQWLAGNTEFLSLIEIEGNIYQAAAKAMGWFPGDGTDLKKKDPLLYALSKACTLGLGFNMGPAKFLLTCEKQGVQLAPVPKSEWNISRREAFILRNQAGIDYKDPAQEHAVSVFLGADAVVQKWRRANPAVADREHGLWARLQAMITQAAESRVDVYPIQLPSGRCKYYYEPRIRAQPKLVIDPETGEESTKVERRIFASVAEGKPAIPLHGGVITENLVQSIARDIMYWGAMDIVEATGWFFVFNAYDEVIFEIPEAEAGIAEAEITKHLCRGSALSWAQGLPLGVECVISDRYLK